MQPVKITLYGDFIDCQIYRGRLYLWTFDGKLKIYKWYDLIDSLVKDKNDYLALKFCFLDGNYLYKNDLIELFEDSDFKKILLNKFTRISKQKFELTPKEADKFLYGEQDTLSNSLPTDTEIYSNKLYYITEDGLFSSKAHRDNKKYPVSSKPMKLWDCNLLSINANKYPQLALSGGDEGLFELNISAENQNSWDRQEPIRISEKHSSFANYTFWSIYNSSLVDKSYMALFNLNKVKDDSPESELDFRKSSYKREYKELIVENRIFKIARNEKYLSWGVEDKIYRATDIGFEIVKFNNNPNKEKGEELFAPIQSVNLHAWKGKVTGGGSSYFGTVVECENALVIMLSNGKNETIEGPITRWRIYPRSVNYQNHLHVIKEDRIEIYSFNQDYFLDQEEKLLGIEYKTQRTSWNN